MCIVQLQYRALRKSFFCLLLLFLCVFLLFVFCLSLLFLLLSLVIFFISCKTFPILYTVDFIATPVFVALELLIFHVFLVQLQRTELILALHFMKVHIPFHKNSTFSYTVLC